MGGWVFFGCHCAFRTMNMRKLHLYEMHILDLALIQTNGFLADAYFLNTWYYVRIHLGNDNDNEICTNGEHVRVLFKVRSFSQIELDFFIIDRDFTGFSENFVCNIQSSCLSLLFWHNIIYPRALKILDMCVTYSRF